MQRAPKKWTVCEYLLNLQTWSRSGSQLYHLQLLSLQTVTATYATPEIIENLHSHLKVQRGLWKIKQVQEIPKLVNVTLLAFLAADNHLKQQEVNVCVLKLKLEKVGSKCVRMNRTPMMKCLPCVIVTHQKTGLIARCLLTKISIFNVYETGKMVKILQD